MKFHHIGNATFIIESKRARILCDPWFSDGIWLGKWFHYPPVSLSAKDVCGKFDYIFISHIHEDHLEECALREFDKRIPVLCLDRNPNFVATRARELGFTDIRLLKEHQPTEIDGKFVAVGFGCAANLAGELVDSSILFDFIDEGTVFNGNDNTPSVDQLRFIREYCFKKNQQPLTFGLLPQGGGSSYPVMYDNLSAAEKKDRSGAIISSGLNLFVEAVDFLKPKYVMPVGGQFIIAGNTVEQNRLVGKPFLETEGPSRYVEKFGLNQSPQFLYMKCGDVFDFDLGRYVSGDNRAFTSEEKENFINSKLPEKPTTVLTTHPQYPVRKLYSLFQICREKQWAAQQRLNIQFDYNVYFDLGSEIYSLNYSHSRTERLSSEARLAEPYLKITVSSEDLLALLVQSIDWNEADGSYRLRFFRKPEQYLPHAYVLLSFLHL